MNSIILVNGTNTTRKYQFEVQYIAKGWDYEFNITDYVLYKSASSPVMTMPPNTFCKLDEHVVPPLEPVKPTDDYTKVWVNPVFLLNMDGSFIKDVTEPNAPIYNGPYASTSGISSCSAMGKSRCASGTWGSWTVGLANLGNRTLQDGHGAYLRRFTTYFVPDNSWNSESVINFDSNWFKKKLALILYQGTTNGDGFAPVYHNFAHPQSCSKFVN